MSKAGSKVRTEAAVEARMAEAPRPRVFWVSSDEHGPADVARASGEGFALRWRDPAKFFEVGEDIFREMSRENQEQYNVTRGLALALARSPREADYGELDIIGVAADSPKARMRLDHPADTHIFYPTVEQAAAALAAGYRYVDTKDTQFKAQIPTQAPGASQLPPEAGGGAGEVPRENRHYVVNRETGRVEHVAMWIPEERYQRHIHATAALHRRKMGAADAHVAESAEEALTRAGVKDAKARVGGVRVDQRGTRITEEKEGLYDAYSGGGGGQDES